MELSNAKIEGVSAVTIEATIALPSIGIKRDLEAAPTALEEISIKNIENVKKKIAKLKMSSKSQIAVVTGLFKH